MLYPAPVVLLCLFFFASCTSNDPGQVADSPSEDPAAPGYRQLHEKIFVKSCAVGGCHDGDKGIGGLTFEGVDASFAQLVGVEPTNGPARRAGFMRVLPGDPDQSLLLWKLAATPAEIGDHNYGAGMPLAAFAAPGEQSMAAIRAWIQAGAPLEGADFEADIADPSDEESSYVTCDATDAEGMRDCFPEAADPDRTLRLFTPPLTLQPGAEHIVCSRLELELDEDVVFVRAEAMQMNGGHHAAIFVSMAPEDGFDPVECDEIDMGAMRFVAGAGGAGAAYTDLPNGTGLRIRKGEQIIIQSHYINSSVDTQTVMDVIDLLRIEADEANVIADAFTVIESEFSIPAGAVNFERTKTCEIAEAIDIHTLLGHTHDFGVLFEFDIERVGQAREQLYHATDGPTLRDNPEIITYDPPLHLEVGDKLHMKCAWTNTTGHALGWPEEMCVAFMYYSPGNGFLICDSDDVVPKILGGGDPVAGCGVPTDAGNELGVGRYCTPEGGECADQTANFCIANFSDNNYCTVILCQDDEVCGEGASCVFEGPGSACVPDYCND